jgi:predicted ATPase
MLDHVRAEEPAVAIEGERALGPCDSSRRALSRPPTTTKSWELRAFMSLARLWRDQGKVQQARDWFTEGFDTRDRREAKALLEELAS